MKGNRIIGMLCLLAALAAGKLSVVWAINHVDGQQKQSFIDSETSMQKGHDGLHEGDLLFCVNPQGNNITNVTQGIGGRQIDHVAIVHKQDREVFALEAIHKGVCLTPIDSFMGRRMKVLQARLKDTVGVCRSVERALHWLGKPYDFYFMPDDSAFYCSELVQKSYLTSKGKLVFKPVPMSFHDKTGKITPYWTAYYAKQGLVVPEGMPGSNPGGLSRSRKIRILGWLQK